MIDEAERLSALFKLRAGTSQAKFGQAHGIGSGSMVWQYLHGRRSLSLESAMKFARGLKVELDSFSPRLSKIRDEILEKPEENLSFGEYAKVPCVRLVVDRSNRRFTAVPTEETPIFIAFRNDWLQLKGLSGAALLATECPDDSMKPTLSQGDTVVINTSDIEPQDGTVYAFGYEDRLLVRRMFRDEGTWWLTCDNVNSHSFARKHYSSKHCFLLGRVVHRQSEVI